MPTAKKIEFDDTTFYMSRSRSRFALRHNSVCKDTLWIFEAQAIVT